MAAKKSMAKSARNAASAGASKAAPKTKPSPAGGTKAKKPSWKKAVVEAIVAKSPAARRAPAGPWTLAEAMAALEKAGSAQTRKTWARHGALEPMFGVSFAAMKTFVKRAGVDHDLARALWETGNHDARTLALKVADPSRVTPEELERWAAEARTAMLVNYVAQLAGETPHGAALAAKWLAAPDAPGAGPAWWLVGQMAMTDTATPDAWFQDRLADIVRQIHTAPNERRKSMNQAVIAIGCRSAGLRKAALAAAKKIGKVDVDHGDTSCKTPDAAEYIEKTWAHSTSKGFESPAAHERSREPIRLRC